MTLECDIFDPKSCREVARTLRERARRLDGGLQTVMETVAERTASIVELGLRTAAEAAEDPVPTVTWEVKDGEAVITASGEDVGFLEFGTGVAHPEHSGKLFADAPKHGTYGKGKGATGKKWAYKHWDRHVRWTDGSDPAEAFTTAAEWVAENLGSIIAEEVNHG